MFEKFTERARTVMRLSRQEAQRLKSEFIGTEHVLLGILQEGDGVAAKVLKNLQVDLKRIRQEIDKLITPSKGGSVELGQLPFSPRVKKAVEYAGDASVRFGHDVISTEHLLLGLLKEREGIAAHILANLGLKLDEVSGMVLEIMGVKDYDPEITRSESPVPWSAGVRAIAERAIAEAFRLKSRTIEPEHLLLGLLAGTGAATEFLLGKGITREAVLKITPRQ
jgi:ATP-dependent Clp protease ATP-binding subunit ClpC